MRASGGPAASRRFPERMSPVLSAIYIAVVGLILLRAGLNSLILNQFINYGTDGGIILEKIHPSFYGLLAVGIFALVSYRTELTAWETSVVRRYLLLAACSIAMLVYAGAHGTGGSAGFMVDSYVTICFSTLLFLFPARLRAYVGKALLLFFLLSALIALAEFGLRFRLLPFHEVETAFRPTGLSSHPLELGLWCAVSIPLTAATDWSRGSKIALSAIFFAALAASGARTALVCGSISTLIVIFAAVRPNVLPQRRLERRLILGVVALLAVPAAYGLLSAAGTLQRFDAGVNDSNTQARYTVYQVFDGMAWSDILTGPGMPEVTRIALKNLHLVAIESPIVIFIAIFGAIWTVMFIGVFTYVLLGALRGALPAMTLAAVLCCIISLSSNGFATKEPSLVHLFVFIIAFRPAELRPRPNIRLASPGLWQREHA